MALSAPVDPSTYGLYTFSFTVGSSLIPGSFSDLSIDRVSAIEIVFNLLSWPFDLGTALGSGSGLPCLPLTGLTTVREGKLSCTLFASNKSTENPTILVTGFDAVPAGSTVSLAVDGLISLPLGVYEAVTIGVRISYRSRDLLYGYLYEPTGVIAGPSTALDIKSASATVTESGLQRVGSLASYSVSFTVPSSGLAVSPADYIRVVFPPYFFDQHNTKAETVTCSGAGTCLLFLQSRHLYVRPNLSLAPGATFTFTIGSLGWSSFKMSMAMAVRVESIVAGKVNGRADTSLTKQASECTSMTAALVNPSSNGGGDSKLNYTFSFKPAVPPPSSGTLTLLFPEEYYSLIKLHSSCHLLGELLASNASCWVSSAKTITMSFNGTTLKAGQQYNFLVASVTNPNGIPSGRQFVLQTYFDENTYLGRVVCAASFPAPLINAVEKGRCNVNANPSISSALAPNNLTLAVLCPSMIENGTLMKVFLQGLTAAGSVGCSSPGLILMQDYCPVRQSLEGSYIEVQLREVGSFTAFSVSLALTNPQAGAATLSLELERGLFASMAGATTLHVTASIASQSASTLALRNYPSNAGEPTVLLFSVSNFNRATAAPNGMVLGFPEAISLATLTGCRLLAASKQFSLVSLMEETGFTEVACQAMEDKLQVAIPAGATAISLAVLGLRNPNKMESAFSLEMRVDKQLLESSQHSLFYSISSGATAAIMDGLSLSVGFIDYPCRYTFSLETAYTVVPSTVVLSVTLPSPSMASSLSTFTLTAGAQSFQLSGKYSPLFGRMFASLPLDSSLALASYSLSVFPIVNPGTASSLPASAFKVELTDSATRRTFLTSINRDSEQVIEYLPIAQVAVSGPSLAYAGSVVTLTVTPGNKPSNLTIIPTVASEGVATLTPSQLVFTNYSTASLSFNISLASSAPS